ncbi:cupin domain-containing protein [Microbacterium hominis]|uniref:cupin domain-containing protein n=1 Tax=Microbacterium hominis TaxID=162426 RepID=UPI001965832D|nr:cupin domain-containing protein [Microbacterium hominis]QRY39508.1 cupin domain-containing protein [Microbacterium hominis]
MSAEILRSADAHLRFGDWGPGYLAQSDDAAFGVVVLRPGDEFANHLHEHHTESFVVLEGSAEVWIDRGAAVVLAPGDVLRAAPGEEHYLRNSFDGTFRAVFVKTPWVDGDKLDRPWTPDPHHHP